MNSSNTSDLTLPCLVHDLNNIFQTLVDAAELLSTDPRWAPLSDVILRSVERGQGLATSLQATDQTAASLEITLNHAISFVEDSLISGRGPKIRFVRDIEPGIELRHTWAWERVFINLFSNAVCAMPQGGTIHVRALKRDHQVEIVVRDDGSGIPPEMLGRIFKPHVSTKRSTGLGLHIVETIVKQEDGEARAANRTDGRGAEFTITFPMEVVAAPTAHSPLPTPRL